MGQRALGHSATSFAIPHPFGYEPGPDITPRSDNKLFRRLDIGKFAASVPFRYEVIHFHGGSFLPPRMRALDARAYKALGRRIVIQFWGSESRLDSFEASRNPFYTLNDPVGEMNKRKMLQHWAEITNGHVIYADNSFDSSLGIFFDHVHVVRQCVDTATLSPLFPREDATTPVVVHAPSRPEIKGTDLVRRAVEEIQAEDISFEYIEMQGRTHQDALDALRRADVVVDQVLLGSHGILAAEAMSLGKPVVCYILPELEPTYPPGFPIINANPSNLTQVLRDLLRNPQRRAAVGRASRTYAERVHDVSVVAEQALSVYDKLL